MDTGFNRLGVTLQEEIDLQFPDIKLRIEITTDANGVGNAVGRTKLFEMAILAGDIAVEAQRLGFEEFFADSGKALICGYLRLCNRNKAIVQSRLTQDFSD